MLTYSITEAAERIGAPSERWLIDQLRAGRFPGRKVGRRWRMTDSDMADAIDSCRINACSVTAASVGQRIGLTPTSRKKVFGL